MMHIITKDGQIHRHTPEVEKFFSDKNVEYAVVDTSIFPDIEWEFIGALKENYVYTYITTKAAERAAQ